MAAATKQPKTSCVPPEGMRQAVRDCKKAMRLTPALDERAELLALLGNATRLRAFAVLDRLQECCVCDLAEILDITPSAASQHLARLKVHGVVTSRRDHQTIFYRLTETAETQLLRQAGLETR